MHSFKYDNKSCTRWIKTWLEKFWLYVNRRLEILVLSIKDFTLKKNIQRSLELARWQIQALKLRRSMAPMWNILSFATCDFPTSELHQQQVQNMIGTFSRLFTSTKMKSWRLNQPMAKTLNHVSTNVLNGKEVNQLKIIQNTLNVTTNKQIADKNDHMDWLQLYVHHLFFVLPVNWQN